MKLKAWVALFPFVFGTISPYIYSVQNIIDEYIIK